MDTNNHIQAELPPDSPIWDPHSVRTVDLWTFIVAGSGSYSGDTFTILAEGSDGFGVSKIQFLKLDRQTQCRGEVPSLFLSISSSSSSVTSFDSSSPLKFGVWLRRCHHRFFGLFAGAKNWPKSLFRCGHWEQGVCYHLWQDCGLPLRCPHRLLGEALQF